MIGVFGDNIRDVIRLLKGGRPMEVKAVEGERWCGHPELVPTMWDQPRPDSAKMIGQCEHNMSCPVCGFGWGGYPDPCDKDYYSRLGLTRYR